MIWRRRAAPALTMTGSGAASRVSGRPGWTVRALPTASAATLARPADHNRSELQARSPCHPR